MPNEDIELGSRLKAAREYLNFSQQEVANAIGGLSRSAISLIESGQRKVSASELKQIAELYNQPIANLLGEEDLSVPNEAVIVARKMQDLSTEDRAEVVRFTQLLIARSRRPTQQ